MKKILLAYDTKSGTTAEISQLIHEVLIKKGIVVHKTPIKDVQGPAPYNAVIIGSPIRFSKCTPTVKKFIKKHSTWLNNTPIAFFFSCVSVVQLENKMLPDIPIYVDPAFDITPRSKNNLNFFEYMHTSWYYLNNLLKLLPNTTPLSIGFLKGSLDFHRIRFHEKLVMRFAKRLIPEIEEGEFISPDAVYSWSEQLYSQIDHVCYP